MRSLIMSLLLLFGGGAPAPPLGVPSPGIIINGVDVTLQVQAAQLEGGRRLVYNRVAGSPASLTLYTYDKVGGAGGYRPAIDQTVVVNNNSGVTVFSGVITDIREEALSDAGEGWDKGILCAVTCADQNGLLLRDTYSHTYADGTLLKAILQDLVTNVLGSLSVTLDAAQANGPAVDGFQFEDAYIDDILNSLTTITGWVWDITPLKVLSMIAPGSVSCGFSLTDSGGGIYGGVSIEQGRSENYANRVTVVYGPAAQVLKTQTIVGNGVSTEWALDYPSMRDANNFVLSAGYVTDDGIFSPISPYPGGSTNWQFDPVTNHLLRTAGALGSTKVATFIYAVQFPQSVSVNDAAEQAAHGVYAKKYLIKDITDLATASQQAAGLLSKGIASPLTVQVTHRKGLAKPGQSVVLTFAERNLNATFMITDVSFWNDVDGDLTFSLGVISGTVQQPTWVDFFKRTGGGSGGGTSVSPASISGALAPSLSGIFAADVIANSGGIATPTFESSLRGWANSAMDGPALLLGRPDRASAWAIVADSQWGSTPGTFARLKFHPIRVGSTPSCAMMLVEPASGAGANWVLLPGATGGLYLGDFAGLITGVGGSDARIKGLLATDIMATAGLYERNRAARMGEWTDVAFNAANFTASGSMTWTVASGDQILFRTMMIGKTLFLEAFLDTTTVGGTLSSELFIAIPGGLLSNTKKQQEIPIFDNNVAARGIARVDVGSATIGIIRGDVANFSASTNLTYVRVSMFLEVQ